MGFSSKGSSAAAEAHAAVRFAAADAFKPYADPAAVAFDRKLAAEVDARVSPSGATTERPKGRRSLRGMGGGALLVAAAAFVPDFFVGDAFLGVTLTLEGERLPSLLVSLMGDTTALKG